MWKWGDIIGESWWNEVDVGQGTGTDRKFVSSWQSFTSSPRHELGFRKEQYLPFNQRWCQAVLCPFSCLCPFSPGPKLFTGNFNIHVSFGHSAHLSPCHEMCVFQRNCSRDFRSKGRVGDLAGFPTGRILPMGQILHPVAERRVGEPSIALTYPKLCGKWSTHPKSLPGTGLNETQTAFLGMREGKKK